MCSHSNTPYSEAEPTKVSDFRSKVLAFSEDRPQVEVVFSVLVKQTTKTNPRVLKDRAAYSEAKSIPQIRTKMLVRATQD